MTEFDRIIANEKARDYKMQDQDQFVFDTLTSIQSKRSKRLKQLLMIAVTTLILVAIAAQLIFVQAASFNSLSAYLQQLVSQKPHYLILFNLALVAVILFFKRARVF